MSAETLVAEDRLARLEERLEKVVDHLEAMNERLEIVVTFAEQQQAAQLARRDLTQALTPVTNDLYGVLVDELTDLERVLTADELVTLLRRLAWNVHNINCLLTWLESLMDLADVVAPIARDAYEEAARLAEEADRRGYVPFFLELGYVLDRIVTGFTPEDVRQLGDHVVLILNTVRQLTQPQMMHLLNNLTSSLQAAEQEAEQIPTDFRTLWRLLNDPEIRRGLVVLLTTLRGIAPEKGNVDEHKV